MMWYRQAAFVVCACAVVATANGASNATQPNIIFFMADDLGWNNVQWHNPDQMKTPHTMKLVHEGLEFDRHYAFVYCSPSRSSLMTGRFPYHVQQINRQNCDLGQGAHKDFTFIAQKLKDVGYETAHVGKVSCRISFRTTNPTLQTLNILSLCLSSLNV